MLPSLGEFKPCLWRGGRAGSAAGELATIYFQFHDGWFNKWSQTAKNFSAWLLFSAAGLLLQPRLDFPFVGIKINGYARAVGKRRALPAMARIEKLMLRHFQQCHAAVQRAHRADALQFLRARIQFQIGHTAVGQSIQKARVFFRDLPVAAVQRPRYEQRVMVNQVEQRDRDAHRGTFDGIRVQRKRTVMQEVKVAHRPITGFLRTDHTAP